MKRIVVVASLLLMAVFAVAQVENPIDPDKVYEISGADVLEWQTELAAQAERAIRFRSLCIVLGTTIAGGVLFVLFTLFGSPMVIDSR